MPDYSKYDIPSPDGYYSPQVECRACMETIVSEEATVSQVLEVIKEHEKECKPKTWLYFVGYERVNSFDPHVGYVRWYNEKPMTDEEKIDQEERAKSFTHGVIVKFEPRTW